MFSNSAVNLVAEISANHGNSLDSCLSAIEEASSSGADWVKIQSYLPEELVPPREDLRVEIPESPWFGRSLLDLYREGATPHDWHSDIFQFARERDIKIFSSPFGYKSLELLESLDCPLYKIASLELCDDWFVREVARTGKPLIVSTGTSTLAEVQRSLDIIKEESATEVAILKCQTEYPAKAGTLALDDIPWMKKIFVDSIIGYSDHYSDIWSAIEAIILGAQIIERHFISDEIADPLDAEFSSAPSDFLRIKSFIDYWVARAEGPDGLGSIFSSLDKQLGRDGRRSLWVRQALPAGHKIRADDLLSLRPNYGVAVQEVSVFLGQPLNRDIEAYTPLTKDLIS